MSAVGVAGVVSTGARADGRRKSRGASSATARPDTTPAWNLGAGHPARRLWSFPPRSLMTPSLSSFDRRSAVTSDRRLRAHLAKAEPVSHQAGGGTDAGQVLQFWDHGFEQGGLSVQARSLGDGKVFEVEVTSTLQGGEWKMHWATDDWRLPAQASWPEGTIQMDNKAVQTPLLPGQPRVIRFVGDELPRRLVFVLTDGTQWLNSGSSDFAVNLAPPSLRTTVDEILASEESSCLFIRYQKALALAPEMALSGDDGMALLFTWLRFSAQKQLRWYHKEAYNYQGKDMASTQKALAETFKELARAGNSDVSRMLARMTLAGLPRGGGNGDDIRMTILHILRDNGIKEGHRPGIEDRFLQQWHQKLHSNTTPEDVWICEAYLHFLHTGNWDDFWSHLWDNRRLTREHLAEMKAGWRNDSGITGPACHLPHLIPAFQHMLWILKVTHSGADLDTAFSMAHGHMDGDTCWKIDDMLKNRNEWWVPGKIAQVRESLQWNWKSEGSSRDVMLLDIALDNYFRTCIERADAGSMSGDDLLAVIELVLRNGCITTDDPGLLNSLQLLQHVQAAEGRWSREWALKVKAALEYTGWALGAYMDRLAELVQPHARDIGNGCGIDRSYITNFAEEVIRGHPLGILSSLLTEMQLKVADASGMGKWQLISVTGDAAGQIVVADLHAIQGKVFSTPTIIISDALGGIEDIPEGVTAVLSSSIVDVLSHIAIRARNQGVLLACCQDYEAFNAFKQLEGMGAVARQDAEGSISVTQAELSEMDLATDVGRARQTIQFDDKPPQPSGWVEREADFLKSSLVGGKSKGIAALRKAGLPGMKVPAAISLPYGCFEKALECQQDHGILARYFSALDALRAAASASSSLPGPELQELRDAIVRLDAPTDLVTQVSRAAAEAGIPRAEEWTSGGGDWSDLWHAIKSVWASKWSDRAWLSRRANGMPDSALHMAVLLQEVIPADFAFVLHTANPLTGDRDELLGQVVTGLGEVLVGNSPGSALTFAVKQIAEPAAILCFPSKTMSVHLLGGESTLIARSDSNGEDLEGFAGAGLYDSIMTSSPVPRYVDYTKPPSLWDAKTRGELAGSLAHVGREIERACGGQPQDIEGVVRNGEIYVVQSRPQVL